MDKKTVAARLLALARDSKKRSKAARLRDVLDDVELALAAGAKRADVVAELQTHGLTMSLRTFETTLKRLRAERRQQSALPRTGGLSCAALSSPVLPGTGQPVHAEHGGTSSHDPSDLDRIVSTQPDLATLARHARRSRK